jgi:hypothetical protein
MATAQKAPLKTVNTKFLITLTLAIGTRVKSAPGAGSITQERRRAASIRRCRSPARARIPNAHEKILDNKHVPGNMAVLVLGQTGPPHH